MTNGRAVCCHREHARRPPMGTPPAVAVFHSSRSGAQATDLFLYETLGWPFPQGLPLALTHWGQGHPTISICPVAVGAAPPGQAPGRPRGRPGAPATRRELPCPNPIGCHPCLVRADGARESRALVSHRARANSRGAVGHVATAPHPRRQVRTNAPDPWWRRRTLPARSRRSVEVDGRSHQTPLSAAQCRARVPGWSPSKNG